MPPNAGFDAVHEELREEYHLPIEEIFARRHTLNWRAIGGKARAGRACGNLRASSRARWWRDGDLKQHRRTRARPRQTTRRLTLLDAFAQSRGGLAKLDDAVRAN